MRSWEDGEVKVEQTYFIVKRRGVTISESHAHRRLPSPLARFRRSIVSVPVKYEKHAVSLTSLACV